MAFADYGTHLMAVIEYHYIGSDFVTHKAHIGCVMLCSIRAKLCVPRVEPCEHRCTFQHTYLHLASISVQVWCAWDCINQIWKALREILYKEHTTWSIGH